MSEVSAKKATIEFQVSNALLQSDESKQKDGVDLGLSTIKLVDQNTDGQFDVDTDQVVINGQVLPATAQAQQLYVFGKLFNQDDKATKAAIGIGSGVGVKFADAKVYFERITNASKLASNLAGVENAIFNARDLEDALFGKTTEDLTQINGVIHAMFGNTTKTQFLNGIAASLAEAIVQKQQQDAE